MVPFRTILCPIDFSECSRRAFHLACSLAKFHGARLVAVHVLDVLYGKQTYAGFMVEVRPDDYPERMLEELKQYKPPYPEMPIVHVLAEGRPVDEILRLSREAECDLIIMGTHGRSGFRHWILGSVTEQVLRQAACPVLTVRLEREPAAEKSAATEPVIIHKS